MKKKLYQEPRMAVADARIAAPVAMIISSEENEDQWAKSRDENIDFDFNDFEGQGQSYGSLW